MSREREVLDLVTDAVLVTDDHWARVPEANAAAARLFGFSRAQLIGRTLPELSTGREEGGPDALHFYRRKDGATLALEISRVVARWKGRAAQVLTCRDVSSRLEAERAQ